MAKERGAFEIYDTEREKNNPFINRLREADPQLYEDMKKYGRRNNDLLCKAGLEHNRSRFIVKRIFNAEQEPGLPYWLISVAVAART